MRDLLKFEIDLGKIKENIIHIQNRSNKKIIPVIKSNAYNLGELEVMKIVHDLNLDYGAVVDMIEAIRLLEFNPNYKILILNSLRVHEYKFLNQFPNLAISINNLEDVNNLKNINLDRKVKVHIQVDTGMNRLGFTNFNEFKTCLNILINIDNVIIEGIYNHFSSLKNSLNQLEKFKNFKELYPFKMVHLTASSTYDHIDYGNYIRVGLDVYGVNKEMQSIKVSCYPLIINNLKKGDTLGYEENYEASEDILVAVLPIGYANGFRRSLKGFNVMVNNKLYPTIGLVCMNHLFVKIDDEVNMDSEFIITSPDYPIEIMAKFLNTTPHEILCMLNIKNIIYIR